MCDNHKNLRKVTTTYSGIDYGAKLQNLEQKKLETITGFKKEIEALFLSNNQFRKQLEQPELEMPDITNKTQEELLVIFWKLKERNDELVNTLNNQEELKEK